MFEDYEVKKAKDIQYRDLEKIVSEFFGRSNFDNFLNMHSSEEVSYKLNEHRRYTREYWLKRYKHGEVFVLKNSTFGMALTYTENGYELRGSNNLFFDSSLKWLISTLRPSNPPLPKYRTVLREPVIESLPENEIKENDIEYDEEIIFKTENKPIKDYPYLVELKSGKKVFGYTNSEGKISRYSTGNKQQILHVYHGDEALYRNGDLA